VVAFSPFAWTRRQQALVERAAAWVAAGGPDKLLLKADELADIETWFTGPPQTLPGIDQTVLDYLARSSGHQKGEKP
jgi:hypothetical protein